MTDKEYSTAAVPHITTDDSREKIVHEIQGLARKSDVALLTLYVYRQMDMIDWLPFIKAVIERNPVCINELIDNSIPDIYKILIGLPNHSIYDHHRLALPDEVWNFRRGDGIEKALLLADIIIDREKSAAVNIEIDHRKVSLSYNHESFEFESSKQFRKSIRISGNNYEIE